ncbi:MAG: nuclear transport factor 2 family protein [Actinomycetota bacterium]|nr:nuclear transport factor 2 family protein [Actinomycetota bacterium]
MRATIKTILPIAILALTAASCSTGQTDDAAAAEEAAATLDANTEAFLAQDLDAYMATVTEDVEFFNDAGASHWVGGASMKSNMQAIFRITDPDATEIIEQFVSDDGAFGVANVHWVGQNNYGNPFDLTYAQLMEFDDGLISKLTMYWEDLDVWEQLSAQPSS